MVTHLPPRLALSWARCDLGWSRTPSLSLPVQKAHGARGSPSGPATSVRPVWAPADPASRRSRLIRRSGGGSWPRCPSLLGPWEAPAARALRPAGEMTCRAETQEVPAPHLPGPKKCHSPGLPLAPRPVTHRHSLRDRALSVLHPARGAAGRRQPGRQPALCDTGRAASRAFPLKGAVTRLL